MARQLVDGDVVPGSGGHGTLQILQVIKTLQQSDIACCVVGTFALRYFGAWRVRADWGICVPRSSLEKARQVLSAEPKTATWALSESEPPYMHLMCHTFPFFKFKGVGLYFYLIPDDDCYLVCDAAEVEYSQMGIPYPKLEKFAQSLLAVGDMVALTDLIDGMDLSMDWGEKNLDLNGTNDVDWIKAKNLKIRNSIPLTFTSCLMELDEVEFSTREIWKEIVETKEKRIGIEMPKEFLFTRFQGRDDEDPQKIKREDV